MDQPAETGCCPRFDPAAWEEREVRWQDKPFVKDRVRTLFHIPLNFGGVMKRNVERIEAAGAKDAEFVCLTDPDSLWGCDVYLSVTHAVPGADNQALSGTFYTKVFEGPYGQVGRWCKEMQAHLAAKQRSWDKIYYWYTTCPRCAKAYGKNHVVLVAACG